MAPPSDFSDLSTAYNASAGTFASVIGVVVDIQAPILTRTDQWMFTFKLLDPKSRDAIYGSQGITVRFFKQHQEHLPRLRNLGDVCLLRNIKVSPFNNQPLLLANWQTSVVVFPAASVPDPSFQVAFQGSKRLECLGAPQDKQLVTLQEQKYVIALHHDMKDAVGGLSSANVVGFERDGFQSEVPIEPTAKRPRLSEPSLPSRPPPGVPFDPAAGRTRQSDGVPQHVPQQVRQSRFGPKYKTVKELAHYSFADLCVEVVKKYPLQYGGCDLYVTDYTTNEAMWYYTPPEEDKDVERDGDEFGYAGVPPKRQFPGPYGWNVLKVNVKDPHAQYINHKIAEGDIVLLRNVKMKIRDQGAKLEGDMWRDDKTPEKVQAIKLMAHDIPEIEGLRLRKEKYWASRKSKVENQENAKLSKSEKRSKKKKAKAEKKAVEVGALDALLKEQSKANINPHVRCSNDEVPITAVKDILDLDNERHTNDPPVGDESYIIPFINAKYRARVRVVDYEPQHLEDFSILAERSDDDDRSVNSIDGMDWQTSQKYVWSFRLLLEDASTPTKSNTATMSNRIWAIFDHESAQYLFGNSMDDPSDLHADKELLAKLREKMYILWGNLEEQKVSLEEQRMGGDGEEGEAVKMSNRAFECCLIEYGVPVDEEVGVDVDGTAFGYRKMFGGFGVTIT